MYGSTYLFQWCNWFAIWNCRKICMLLVLIRLWCIVYVFIWICTHPATQRQFYRIFSIRIKAHLSFLTPEANVQICTHILAQFPAATRNQCPSHWSYLVSVPLPLLSQNGCISMLPVMSDRLRQGVQSDTHGSGTEGLGKMGDLSANRVCL